MLPYRKGKHKLKGYRISSEGTLIDVWKRKGEKNHFRKREEEYDF
jgi:hypothetical protein